MKHWIMIFLLLISFCSCRKEKPYMNSAVITGSDARTCPCCGGLKINFENSLTSTQFYLIANPQILSALSNHSFPIYLYVDWKFTPACGGDIYIEITRYKTK